MNRIVSFFTSPSAGGVLLFVAAVVGVLLANSPVESLYHSLLHAKLGPLSVELWINDVAMAVFFLFVGLEVKREMIDGELNTNAKRFLPGIAAFFGLLMPALIYYFLVVGHHPEFHKGWGIPTATDIAFAIGIVSLLGSRVPIAMKVFLTTLAVMDDLMAIVIIACFYTTELQPEYLFAAAVIVLILFYINRMNYTRPVPYLVLGVALWFCVFQSGIHATLAGVTLAAFIPFSGTRDGRRVSPLSDWEHALSNWVTYLIIPVFGFANAGVSFHGFTLDSFAHPVVLGVAVGLVVGKQVGVFGTLFVLVKTKLVEMPAKTNWLQVYGIALCCGIGFTMSLFVSLLAFPPGEAQEMAKVGIFLGSIVAGILGYIVLSLAGRNHQEEASEDDMVRGQNI